MAVTRQDYTQAGSTITYVVPFEVIEATDIDVYVNNVLQLQQNTTSTADATHPQVISGEITQGTALTNYTVASNNGTITFNAVLTAGDYIVVERTTDDAAAVTFVSGSTIRAKDLNDSFDQIRFLAQEAVFTARQNVIESRERDNSYTAQGYKIENLGDADSDDDAVNRGQLGKVITDDLLEGEAINLTDATGGTNSNKQVTISVDKSTASQRGVVKITAPSVTNGNPITINRPADGDVELSITDNSIDFSKIKDVDIITESEQNAGTPSPADTNLFTGAASSKRFDTIVSDTTPVGSDWEVGKTWLQQSPDNTLSIWNGSGWIGVASGGTFTTQPSVIYVDSENGNDSFDGHRIINPKRTIKNAVASANAGDIVYVVPGVYQEALPINITVSNLSIVGQSIRSCFIHPTAATETETMFRCNSGTYITGFTFAGLKASGSRGGHSVDNDTTYGLPTNQGWVAEFYPGSVIRKSPYIQNCTNFADSGIDNDNFDPNNFQGTGGDLTSAPTGGGIFVDGSVVDASSPLRSFVVDSFTQICLDGPGCLVANNGYAQLVSFFGTFCHYHTKALNGGQANLTNSTTDFGRYGLIADGKSSSAIFTSTANGAASAGDTTFAINEPTDNWFGTSTRPLDNMLVQIGSDIYEILSSSPNGLGWNVTISNPNPANRAENLGLDNPHANGAAVSFFLQSFISTSSHTFEYAGTGTDYRALPQNGGVAIEANQVISRNDGRVWLSSTDQNGKFKVGDTFEVNQRTGFVTIDPQSVATNVISDSSPQLGGDLDVLDKRIYSSSGNVHVNDTLEVNLGSASNPAITFNGDTNTGLYSPGADQLAISTGGTGRIFVDANGNVGIGAAPPTATNAAGYREFLVKGGSTNRTGILRLQDGDGTDAARLYANEVNGLELRQELARPISFWTNGTEKARITSDGNLGLGTSSPGYRLDVKSPGSGQYFINGQNSLGNDIFQVYQSSAGDGNNGMLFLYNNAGEANVALKSTGASWFTGGNVGIGTTSPGALLDCEGSSTTDGTALHINNTTGANTILVSTGSSYSFSGVGASTAWLTSAGTKVAIGPYTAGDLQFINGGEKARIDSSGRLLVGTSTSANRYGIESQLQVSGASRAASSISLSQTDGASAESGAIYFWSSGRNESDSLGLIQFGGGQGGYNATNVGATIEAIVDGPTYSGGDNTDLPGRLVFSTTADGASTPTERMRITSTGALGFSGANYGNSGQVLTSNGSGSAPSWQTAQTAKAWVHFDGTAATITPADSYNVSSITDRGTGRYTVNLTNTLGSTNPACFASGTADSSRIGNASPDSTDPDDKIAVGFKGTNDQFYDDDGVSVVVFA